MTTSSRRATAAKTPYNKDITTCKSTAYIFGCRGTGSTAEQAGPRKELRAKSDKRPDRSEDNLSGVPHGRTKNDQLGLNQAQQFGPLHGGAIVLSSRRYYSGLLTAAPSKACLALHLSVTTIDTFAGIDQTTPGAPTPTGTGGACGTVYSALSNSATPSVNYDVDDQLSAGDKTFPGAGGSLFATPTAIICSIQISNETSAAFIVSATSPQAYPTGVSDMTLPRNILFPTKGLGTGGACPAAPVNIKTGVNDKIDYCRRSSRTPKRIEQYKPGGISSRHSAAQPARLGTTVGSATTHHINDPAAAYDSAAAYNKAVICKKYNLQNKFRGYQMHIGTTYSMPIGGVGSTTGAAVHSGAKSTSRTTAFTAFNATARAGLPTPTSVTSQSCGTEVKKDKTAIDDIQILNTEGDIIKAPSEFESVITVELKGFRPSFSTTSAAGYPGAASSAPRSNTNDWSSSLQTKIPISISPN